MVASEVDATEVLAGSDETSEVLAGSDESSEVLAVSDETSEVLVASGETSEVRVGRDEREGGGEDMALTETSCLECALESKGSYRRGHTQRVGRLTPRRRIYHQ
jgi:hypothetical protein